MTTHNEGGLYMNNASPIWNAYTSMIHRHNRTIDLIHHLSEAMTLLPKPYDNAFNDAYKRAAKRGHYQLMAMNRLQDAFIRAMRTP